MNKLELARVFLKKVYYSAIGTMLAQFSWAIGVYDIHKIFRL